jgi:hypothetical protein
MAEHAAHPPIHLVIHPDEPIRSLEAAAKVIRRTGNAASRLIHLILRRFFVSPARSALPVGRSVGRICSSFELANRTFAERRIAREVVPVNDRAHAAHRVSGDGGDFRLGGTHKRQPGDGGATQIVKRQPGYARRFADAQPCRAEGLAGPRPAVSTGEDDWAASRCGVEHGLERRAH